MNSSFTIGGRFRAERWSADGRLLEVRLAKNGLTVPALNNVLEVYCRQQANSTWKIGLIDDASFTELAADDTMGSHPGWIENVDYSEGTRPLWGPGAASGQVSINPFGVRFTMTATKTINGLFLSSDAAKSGVAGLLFCTGSFDAPLLMEASEICRTFYSLSAEGR